MATKQSRPKSKAKTEELSVNKEAVEEQPAATAETDMEGQALDPQEEKVLDWILKGVVAFILGWLGLSILMVVGGYFGIWK
jgi:hypothetical protein